MHHEENISKGISFIVLTFLMVAIMSALGKAAAPYAAPMTIVFFQNGISLLLVIPLILKKGIKKTFYTQHFGLHLLRAASGTLCWYCLFLAIKLVDLNVAVLLIYSAPLWMPILGLIFGEKSHFTVWLGVLIGFIGIALVLQVHSLGPFEHYGVWVGIGGGILLAIAMLAVRWLNRTEDPTSILSYYFLLATLMVAPLTYFNFDMQVHNPKAWIYVIAIGAMLASSQYLIIKAFQYASAVKLSPFIYSVIVFTALINWWFWNIIPHPLQILGMLLVIGGGVGITAANKTPPTQPTRK